MDNAMIEAESVVRLLTIKPEDLSRWTKLCRGVVRQVDDAHPNYPRLRETQLLSYVKRLLPHIRTMVLELEQSGGRAQQSGDARTPPEPNEKVE